MKPYIQYLPATAELILKTSGRGSFIAPAVGFLHFGPDCYLYDHVCNFNYQGVLLVLNLSHRRLLGRMIHYLSCPHAGRVAL